MTLADIKVKKEIANKMHDKNTNRLEKIFWSKIGTMFGVALTMAGAMIVGLATAGVALTVGAVVTGIGAVTALGSHGANIGLRIADRKALKELKKEFPDMVEYGRFPSYSMEYSQDVIDELTKQEDELTGNKTFYLDNEGMKEDMYTNYLSYVEERSIHSDRGDRWDDWNRERFD